MVKNPLAIQDTQVRSLVWEDPLQKEIATRSSILAWEIPLTEEPGGLQSMGSQRVGHNLETKQRQHGYMTDFYAFILVSSTFMEITNHSQQ